MEKNVQNNWLRLDLQRFADGEEFGAYDPSTAYEGIDTGTPATPEGGGEPTPPLAGEEPLAEPPAEPEYLDFGGRKVLANDETRGLYQDFLNQQRYITQLTQQQPQAQAPSEPEPVSANMNDWNEDTWNRFYEKPQEVLAEIINGSINQVLAAKVDPILEERQWEQNITEMNEQFHDFGDYTESIQEILESNPALAESREGLERAYFQAKAMAADSQPSPEQLMQNPQFIQSLLQNPQVQQQFLNQYLNQKQQTNQQIPNLMGRGTGGFTPATPENSPTSLREASRLFMKQLGNR